MRRLKGWRNVCDSCFIIQNAPSLMQFLSLLWEGKSLSPVTWANEGTTADTCSSSRTIRFLSWVKRRRNNFPWTAQHGGHYLCLSDTVSNTLTWLCLWTPPIASVSVKLLLQHKSSHASRLWIFLNIGKFSKKKKKKDTKELVPDVLQNRISSALSQTQPIFSL